MEEDRSVDREETGDAVRRLNVRWLVVAGLFVLAVLAGANTFHDPETCGTCSGHFRFVPQDEGVDATVENATVAVRLRPDGDSRWTVRADVAGPGADRLRDNGTLVDAIARYRPHNYPAVIDSSRNLTARMDGNTLVVSYPVEDVATQYGEVLVVDDFFESGSIVQFGTAEELHFPVVLHPPSGGTIRRVPAGARRQNDTVVWTEEPAIGTTRYPVVSTGEVSDVTVELAVARRVAGWAGVPIAVVLALVGGVTLLVADRLVARTIGRRTSLDRARRRLARTFDESVPGRPPRWMSDRWALYPADVLVVGCLTGVCTAGVALNYPGVRKAVLLSVLVPVLPLALFFGLGVAVRRGPRYLRGLLGLLAGSAVLLAVASVLEDGSSRVVVPRSILVWTVVVPVLGVFAFNAGRAWVRDGDSDDE